MQKRCQHMCAAPCTCCQEHVYLSSIDASESSFHRLLCVSCYPKVCHLGSRLLSSSNEHGTIGVPDLAGSEGACRRLDQLIPRRQDTNMWGSVHLCRHTSPIALCQRIRDGPVVDF